MEDEDCSVNDEGQIDVRYRGWTEIDSSIWNFYEQVLSLDLSFNHLQSIPKEIGNLRRLTILNLEHNEVMKIPEEIGKLRALKVLKLNQNKLTTLPDSIENCFNLKMLYLNDNNMVMLPQSIGKCINLELLRLENNNLIELPLSIAQLKETLSCVDVTNNPKLAIIPEKVQGNSEVTMWILIFRYERTMEIRAICEGVKRMGELMRSDKEKLQSTNREIEKLQANKRDLMIEREDIWIFLKFRDIRRRIQFKGKKMIQQARNLFDTRSPKIVVL